MSLIEQKELWKTLPILNGKYEISNKGNVRSLWYGRIKPIKLQNSKHGYYTFSAYCGKSKAVTVRVHKLVAEAFIGQCPQGYVVNHKDGDKHNNNVANLEYVTYSENNIHALKHRLRKPANMKDCVAKRGENNYNHILTEEQVILILKYHYTTGYGGRKIAKHFGLKRSTVNGVIYGRTWKHIDREKIRKEVEENA